MSFFKKIVVVDGLVECVTRSDWTKIFQMEYHTLDRNGFHCRIEIQGELFAANDFPLAGIRGFQIQNLICDRPHENEEDDLRREPDFFHILVHLEEKDEPYRWKFGWLETDCYTDAQFVVEKLNLLLGQLRETEPPCFEMERVYVDYRSMPLENLGGEEVEITPRGTPVAEPARPESTKWRLMKTGDGGLIFYQGRPNSSWKAVAGAVLTLICLHFAILMGLIWMEHAAASGTRWGAVYWCTLAATIGLSLGTLFFGCIAAANMTAEKYQRFFHVGEEIFTWKNSGNCHEQCCIAGWSEIKIHNRRTCAEWVMGNEGEYVLTLRNAAGEVLAGVHFLSPDEARWMRDEVLSRL